MHDSRVSSADDALVLEDSELGLESGDRVDGLVWAGEHVSGRDVFVVDTAEANADVITDERGVDFLLDLVEERRDLDLDLVGHEDQALSFAEMARLDLADDDGTHILVLFGDGHHKWSVELAINHGHLVDQLEE